MPREIDLASFDFAEVVRRGDLVCWGQGPAEPLALTQALMAQRQAIGSFSAFIGMSWVPTPDPAFCDHVRFSSYCATGYNRQLAAAGQLDILPIHYSMLPDLLASRVDVLLLQVARSNEDDTYSLGMACEYLEPVIASARVVIAEVNDRAPFTFGERIVHADELDLVVRTSRELPDMPTQVAGEVEIDIARRVAGLVEDGAVLQAGLGGIPEHVARALTGHRDLGIHSGLMTESMADLIALGVVTNRRKSIDTGRSVTGLLAGSQRLADFAARNDGISLRATRHTHSQSVIERLDRFTAVNSAVEVDLTGQVNAESVGGRYVGAVGGAADFLRGAHRSRGGLPIVALPATVRGRNGSTSRIVSKLDGPVSTSRADAGIIVTEYGTADLRGRTTSERIERMIAIADPAFRERLEREAHALRG